MNLGGCHAAILSNDLTLTTAIRLAEENRMINYRLLATATVLFGLVSVNAATPDPKVLAYQLPDKTQRTGNPGGAQQAIMAGDPMDRKSRRRTTSDNGRRSD